MIPVYIFSGLLDAGKSGVIKETLYSPQFLDGSRTLIIAFERGEDEYDERFLKYTNSFVLYFESFKDLSKEVMEKINAEYEFDEIFIEGNGMEDEALFIDKMADNWELAQTLCVVDASKFRLHVANLKTFIYYHIKTAECIIFNRFDNKDDYLFIRNNVLGLNPKAELIFENSQREIVSFKDFQLFDLSKDLIEIDDINYGAWYVDASEKPQKYEGKRIRINVKYLEDLKEYPVAWIMGRKAMICCSEDIADMGLTVIGIDKKAMNKEDFYELEGVIRVIEAEDGYDTCLLYVDKYTKGHRPKDEMVYFN